MTINNDETSPRFKLIMRFIGIAVSISPIFILLIAPAPIGINGDYAGTKGMAFLYFVLSIPAGLFLITFGKRPSKAKKGLLIAVAIWAGFSVFAVLGDLVNRLFQGTL